MLFFIAIVDHEGRFLFVSAKWPGSSHDSFVLNQSPVWENFETGRQRGFILGDSGYATRTWLLTPYNNPDTHVKKRFLFALN